ncbi:MAG: sulfatase [Deltaproteobacteria bacterium]|nr:sulfatase [Deltaproteobacteria bacterium]
MKTAWKSAARASSTLVAFAIAALLAACGATSDRPNIVFISIDTLRADQLGEYGNEGRFTPVLDELAKRGVRFAQARTTAPWTLPSHASAFTGLFPTDHRAIDDRMKIRGDAPMLTEILHDAGYRTTGFVTHYYVGEDYGFKRGFDEFTRREEAPADQMVDLATRWLRENAGRKPVFVFLHLFDPHTPYTPPPSLRVKHVGEGLPQLRGDTAEVMDAVHGRGDPKTVDGLKALYQAEIESVDQTLGRFFHAIERMELKNTIVVLMADHGEEFLDHQMMEHGFTLYDEQLRVPLLVAWPDHLPAGTVVDTPVSLIDVMPTIVDLAGATPPAGIAGKSLVPIMRDPTAGAAFADRVLISETTRLGPDRVSVVKDGWKYIYSPTFRLNDRPVGERLFDLTADPHEKNDLLKAQPERAKTLIKAIFDTGLYVKRRQFSVFFAGTSDPHKYLGTLRSAGSFIAANKDNIILDTDAKRQLVTLEFGLKKEEKRLQFLALGKDGDNGVTFIQEPENAELRFDLLVDDRRDTAKVSIGAGATPDAIPFAVPADVAGSRSFTPGGGYTIWCDEVLVNAHVLSRFEVGDQLEMSPDMVEKLKSLGYIDEGGAIKKGVSSEPKSIDPSSDVPGPGAIEYRCTPLPF